MTPEELQEVVAAVIQALKTNSKTIDQLTPVTTLANSDNLEVSGGKKIAFSKLKELVASAVVVTEESIKGWVPIESTEDLPEEPTPEEQEKAYIIAEDSMLYVYVGEGGDTLDGLYQSVELQGPQGETGPAGADGHDGVDLGEVVLVNDLTTGGEGNALSAEMGKTLKGLIDGALDSEGVGLDDVTISIKFKLTQTLTNITSSTDATSVSLGSSLSITLTPDSGYSIFSIVVSMGGVDITSTAYSSNVVSIAEVDGDVVITAVAIEAGVQPVVFADSAVEEIILANFPHENEGAITEEEALAITDIGTVFKNNTEITSFDELSQFGVTALAREAFYGCTALESIDLSKINSIGLSSEGNAAGQNCFRYCSSLTKVVLNSNVTKIPNNCFRDCTSLAVFDASGVIDTWGSSSMSNCACTAIIFRNTSSAVTYNSMRYQNCTLYVPDALLATYAETSWAQNNDYPTAKNASTGRQMKKLSEYVEV